MGNIKEYLNKIKNAVYGKDVRNAIHDGIKQCYDDAIANGHTNMEISQARGGYASLNERIDANENAINSLASGSPLVASSIEEMTDITRTYVLTTDGNWYYYNGMEWAVGGNYLSSEDYQNLNYIVNTTNFGESQDGRYVEYGTGKIGVLASTKASGFIKILPKSKINISNLGMNNNNQDARGLAFYNINKEYISGYQYLKKSPAFTILAPDEAYYMRFTYANNEPDVNIIFKFDKIVSDLSNPAKLDNSIFNVTEYIKENLNSGGYINSTNGQVQIYTNTNIYFTNYFPVVANSKLRISNITKNTDVRGFAFYDENEIYISGQNYSEATFVADVPEGTKFVALTINNVDIENIKVEMELSYEEQFYILANINKLPVLNPTKYTGKEIVVFNKMIAIGDSLTAGVFDHNENGSTEYNAIPQYSYPTQLAKKTGIQVTNLGNGGLTTKRWYEVHKNDDFSGHDFAIINLGANDTQANNMTTSLAEQYLNLIIAKLKEENKNIKIFIASLLPNYYFRQESHYSNFYRIIKNIAETTQNCYFIDLSLFSSCKNDTVYSQGHLTALGYAKEADELIAYISYIINRSVEDFKYIQFVGTENEVE